MRIVTSNASIEPEHLIDAEKILEAPFQLLTADARIALLHFAQQAFFGGEQSALTVYVD